ncbi:MAG: hypothetical protein HGA61_02185, partial [Candidatus Moranbacteria bacterium]|nr:hypothetical protein [Candidatus Moranbacteria bacterium]
MSESSSVAEKLAQLNQKKKQAQEFEIGEKRLAELKPVYAKIKELEAKLAELDLIKGSLESEPEKNNREARGMKKYAQEVGVKMQAKKSELERLLRLDENKETLAELGIENPDQLASHSLFQNDTESVAYVEAKKQTTILGEADISLREKLVELDIILPQDDFSYATAEIALAEKMKAIEEEILQEELKTPEGKVKVIEKIAREMTAKLPRTSFVRDENEKTYRFNIISNNYVGGIVISDAKKVATFENWQAMRLPEGFSEFETKYGEDISREALKRAYQKKIEESFENFDKKKENVAELLIDLDRANPQKAREASNALENFEQNSQEYKKKIDEKIASLREKGITFSDDGSFLDAYNDLLKLTKYNREVEEIKKSLQDLSTFPPLFDWERLKEKITVRTKQLEDFSEAILSIQNEDEVNNFLRWGENKEDQARTLERFLKDYSKQSDFSNGHISAGELNPRFKFTSQNENNAKLPENFDEARKYLEGKQAKLTALKNQVTEKVFTSIETHLKEKELLEKAKTLEFGVDAYQKNPNVRSIEKEISEIEKARKDAEVLSLELARLEAKFPQGEKLSCKGVYIEVISMRDALQEMRNKLDAKEKKLAELEDKEFNYNIAKRPKFFSR